MATVFSYYPNPRVWKAEVVCALTGQEFKLAEGFDMRQGHHQTPDFYAMNPFGKVPTVKVEDGAVFESNAMARLFAKRGQGKMNLLGKTITEQARIDSFLDAELGFYPDLSPWQSPIIGWGTPDAEKTKIAQEKVQKWLSGLERALTGKDYLVGDSITLADIVWVCVLTMGMAKVFDAAYVQPFPNVKRWFLKHANSDVFKQFHKIESWKIEG